MKFDIEITETVVVTRGKKSFKCRRSRLGELVCGACDVGFIEPVETGAVCSWNECKAKLTLIARVGGLQIEVDDA